MNIITWFRGVQEARRTQLLQELRNAQQNHVHFDALVHRQRRTLGLALPEDVRECEFWAKRRRELVCKLVPRCKRQRIVQWWRELCEYKLVFDDVFDAWMRLKPLSEEADAFYPRVQTARAYLNRLGARLGISEAASEAPIRLQPNGEFPPVPEHLLLRVAE